MINLFAGKEIFAEMKEKKSYSEAELEVIRLARQDIITASGNQGGLWDGDENVDPDGWI